MNVFENARIFHLGCFQSDQLDRRTEIDSQMNRVFVGNLPKDIVESELRVGIMEVVRKISPKTQIIKVGHARVNSLFFYFRRFSCHVPSAAMHSSLWTIRKSSRN